MKLNRSFQTAASVCVLLVGGFLSASSHMDAPLITFDDAANTTDVYAFRSRQGGLQYLTTAVAVYPFEEPGIGPNKYNFDDNVLYAINVSIGPDLAMGRTTLSYRFRFETNFKNSNTILQSYLGVVQAVDGPNQNLTQTYSVTVFDSRDSSETSLGSCVVPPNNQGIATPFYNQGNDGNNPAKPGVSNEADLDPYTQQAICNLASGHVAFAGQRDDGFYADIQAVFDLLQLRGPEGPFDSQGGFNVHTIALNIPLSFLGGEAQVVGVHATTSRPSTTVLPQDETDPQLSGPLVQVARQGNPLFNEAFVPVGFSDLYSRTTPERDRELFETFALNPELGTLINAIVFGGNGPAVETGRTDLAGIFIPDVIKVDLSTGPARLAGPPDDDGFSRLSVFGGDALTSTVQPGLPGFPAGTIPGGWPNGRRFGDDVVDIAVTAAISDLRGDPLIINGPAGDSVDANDIPYNKVFPYAATPLNGRNHGHHDGALSTTVFLPQFGNGDGFSSEIVLSNLSTTSAASGLVRFRNDDGQSLPISLQDGQGTVSEVAFNLPAAGSRTISTDGLGVLAVGSATVDSDSPVSAFLRFNVPGIGIVGIQASPPLSRFTMPVRIGDGIRTAIAVLNAGAGPVTLQIMLRDGAGNEVASTTIENLVGGGHTARFVDELFLNEALDGFRGSLLVRVQGGSVAAMALEQGLNPGEFTSLPVSPIS